MFVVEESAFRDVGRRDAIQDTQPLSGPCQAIFWQGLAAPVAEEGGDLPMRITSKLQTTSLLSALTAIADTN